MNTANDKGVDVPAVMDRTTQKLRADDWHGAPSMEEARAAVAEAFAERDKLRNIVRSHEAQILRMTAERAELVEAAEEQRRAFRDYGRMEVTRDTDPLTIIESPEWDRLCDADMRLKAALARVGGAK